MEPYLWNEATAAFMEGHVLSRTELNKIRKLFPAEKDRQALEPKRKQLEEKGLRLRDLDKPCDCGKKQLHTGACLGPRKKPVGEGVSES